MPQEALQRRVINSENELDEDEEVEIVTVVRNGIITETTADIETGKEGELLFYLDIPVGGFPVSYQFTFLPVAREPIDVLESTLHEAQEDIADLRAENALLREEIDALRSMRTGFISLRSSIACGNKQPMSWNVLVRNSSPNLYEVMDNNNSIRIHAEGVYQVFVRVTCPEASGNRKLQLQVNNTTVAKVYDGNNIGYKTTVYMNDIVVIPHDAVLRIIHSSNSNTMAAEMSNQWSIVRLA
jgi:hypothetical protein